MPYARIDDLPEEVRTRYESDEALSAFLSAFNSALANCEGDDCESQAFAIAHNAAQAADSEDKALDHDGVGYVILNLGMNPEIFGVVQSLRPQFSEQFEWRAPEKYHLTIAKFYFSTLDDPWPNPNLPEFNNFIGSEGLGVFQSEGATTLYLDASADGAVRDYQAIVASILRFQGYTLDPYSEPANFIPHISIARSLPISLPTLPEFEPIIVAPNSVSVSIERGQTFDITTVKTPKPTLKERLMNFLKLKPKVSFKEFSGFKALGNGRWIAWYTNAYKDGDNEYIAESSIEADIAKMHEDGQFPELWYFHIPGTRIGQADSALKVGRFAVATGTFDDTELGRHMQKYLKDNPHILSHGFHFQRDKMQGDVYYQHHTFEISPLPIGAASNPYTFFAVEDGKKMSQHITDAMLDHFRKALVGSGLDADQIVKQGLEATKQADALTGHDYKAASDDQGSEPQWVSHLTSAIGSLTNEVKALREQAVKAEGDMPDEEDTDDEDGKADGEVKTLTDRIARLEAALSVAQSKSIQNQFAGIMADAQTQGRTQAPTFEEPFAGAVAKALHVINKGD